MKPPISICRTSPALRLAQSRPASRPQPPSPHHSAAERAAHRHRLRGGHAACDPRRPAAIDAHRASRRGEGCNCLRRGHGGLGLRWRPRRQPLHQRSSRKLRTATTDIHIVSDHGNEYTLQLREVSSDDDPHFDSKVFIVPGDKAAKDRLAELPVFVPAAELDKAKQEAAAAQGSASRRAEGRGDQGGAVSQPVSRQAALRLHLGQEEGQGAWACSRFGATTSSPICAASFRRRPRSTS